MINTNISVVCPTFNSALYIGQTINSILNQQITPNEIVFSDDGSTDDTVKIIKNYFTEFKKKGINFIVLENDHQGPGSARNHGIIVAQHPWIAFLDSDDIWYPSKIKIIKEKIVQNYDSNFFVHWENHQRLNGKKTVLKVGSRFISGRPLGPQLLKRNFISTSTVVCKKELIEKVGGFDISLPNSQDYDLWLRMSPYINIFVIPEILGEYISVATSITSRPYFKRYFVNLKVALKNRNISLISFLYNVLRQTITSQWFK